MKKYRRVLVPLPFSPSDPLARPDVYFLLLCCIFTQDDQEVKALGDDVKAFARRWPMPGFETSELKFTEMDH